MTTLTIAMGFNVMNLVEDSKREQKTDSLFYFIPKLFKNANAIFINACIENLPGHHSSTKEFLSISIFISLLGIINIMQHH